MTTLPDAPSREFDYSFVNATARVALYDDMRSAPRITEVRPSNTVDFIEKLTTTVYEQSRLAGGKLPYTLIREVAENFIHAQFKEIVVSIFDDGNTIRFADQGPGIKEKEKAQEPGFSSAIEPMKQYIRGVGSGFPIVKDYLSDRKGSIEIEDNLVSGAVITVSLRPKQRKVPTAAPLQRPASLPPYPFTARERDLVAILSREGELGITEIKEITGDAGSTIFNALGKLEEAGIIEKSPNKKRSLTELGYEVASQI